MLAQVLGMSPRNVSRRFKRATGRLPGNYLQAMRVAIAKEMLKAGPARCKSSAPPSARRMPPSFAAVQARHRYDARRVPQKLRGQQWRPFPRRRPDSAARGTPTSGATPGPPPASSCRAAAPAARPASRLEVGRGLDELRALDVEGIGVEHGIALALEQRGHDRYGAAARAHVKIGAFAAEEIARGEHQDRQSRAGRHRPGARSNGRRAACTSHNRRL